MRWLITGGAGFIGSNLARELIAKGETVRVVDNLITGRLENLDAIKSDIEFIPGDLIALDVCARAVAGCEIVLHQAALGSVPRSVANPLATHHANATATVNLLLAARDAKVRRVVQASSSSIYGQNPALPKREGLVPMPISPYAVSKLAQEQYGLAFHAVYGLEVVALRYFNVYGPRQDPNSAYAAVVPLFIQAALEGRAPVIHGDGGQTRDFTFVGDVVAANLAAAQAENVGGRVMNIAAGGEISVLDLWAAIKKITAAAADPVHQPSRPGDVRHSRADNTQARELIGWSPAVGLEEGLKRTIEWMKGDRTGRKARLFDGGKENPLI